MLKLDRGATFVGMGFEIVGLLLLGVWLGGFIDKKFALNGMGTAGMVILALVGWFIHLVQLLKKYQNDQDQPPKS